MGLSIFVTINIVVLGFIIWNNARSLNISDARRTEKEQELQRALVELNLSNENLQAEIRQRQQAERLLRLANENLDLKVAERTAKLQEANEELETFSFSVSHDLQAPLRAIDGFSRLLTESSGDKLNAEERMLLDRVCRNSERMGRLIRELLNLSRVSRSEIHRSDLDLSEMATHLIADLRRAEPARQVEVVIQPGLRARGDENLVHSVLENLLNNAWKFTRKREKARIQFRSEMRGGQKAFVVSDNGAGFNMQNVGRLFGAFQRLHRAEDFEGTGVGLATVQRIIRRHSGVIFAEGHVNQGAAFSFTLPE